jgi:hypothetical protein
MNRPGTFTLLSILSLLLSIGGLAASWANLNGSGGVSSIVLGAVSFAYAIAAAATAIGLWRCRNWVVPAFRIWVAVFVIFLLSFVYFYSSMFVDSVWAIIGFLVFVAVLTVFLDKYVRRKLAVATQPVWATAH